MTDDTANSVEHRGENFEFDSRNQAPVARRQSDQTQSTQAEERSYDALDKPSTPSPQAVSTEAASIGYDRSSISSSQSESTEATSIYQDHLAISSCQASFAEGKSIGPEQLSTSSPQVESLDAANINHKPSVKRHHATWNTSIDAMDFSGFYALGNLFNPRPKKRKTPEDSEDLLQQKAKSPRIFCPLPRKTLSKTRKASTACPALKDMIRVHEENEKKKQAVCARENNKKTWLQVNEWSTGRNCAMVCHPPCTNIRKC